MRPFLSLLSALFLSVGVFAAAGLRAQTPTPVPSPAPETAAEVDSATMEASFDFAQGVILLDVDLSGGHVVKLALDTGDKSSVLDRALAEELKLPFGALPFSPGGQGPDISTPQIAIAKVGIGDGSFVGKPFLILPLVEELKAMGITCQGTIGYRFFEDGVVQIDYPARKLRKLAAMPPAPAGAVVLPMQWKQYHKDGPGVTTTNQFKLGDQTAVAQIDTLFSRTMLLFANRWPTLESKRMPELASAYYEGGILRAALPTQTVSLGGHVYEHAPPAYLADRDARHPDTDIAAVLGNVFFLEAVVTFDYKKDQIMIEWKK